MSIQATIQDLLGIRTQFKRVSTVYPSHRLTSSFVALSPGYPTQEDAVCCGRFSCKTILGFRRKVCDSARYQSCIHGVHLLFLAVLGLAFIFPHFELWRPNRGIWAYTVEYSFVL